MEEQSIYGNLEVGAGVVIKGDCQVPGQMVVSGEVIGKIQAQELYVNKTGLVQGQTRANQIDVRGVLREEVHCDGFLMIRQTGEVDGEINYTEIEVENGGVMSGQLNRS